MTKQKDWGLLPCRGCGGKKDTGKARTHFCSKCQDDPLSRPLLMNSSCKNGHLLKDVGLLLTSNGKRKRWACKECERIRRVEMWHDPETTSKARECGRKSRLQRNYGLSIEDWEKLYDHQHGKCPICKKELSRGAGSQGKVAAVDHDHKTGKIRGLLCRTPCNYILGYLHDNAEMFRAAGDYLSKPPAYGFMDKTVPKPDKKRTKKFGYKKTI